MSGMLGRISAIDLAAWLPSLSVWTAGAAAALLAGACAVSFSRAGRAGPIGVIARVALVLIGAGAAFIAFDGWSRLDLAAERHALEARAQDLLMRSAMPVSAASRATPSNPHARRPYSRLPRQRLRRFPMSRRSSSCSPISPRTHAGPGPTFRWLSPSFAAPSRATALDWLRACSPFVTA